MSKRGEQVIRHLLGHRRQRLGRMAVVPAIQGRLYRRLPRVEGSYCTSFFFDDYIDPGMARLFKGWADLFVFDARRSVTFSVVYHLTSYLKVRGT